MGLVDIVRLAEERNGYRRFVFPPTLVYREHQAPNMYIAYKKCVGSVPTYRAAVRLVLCNPCCKHVLIFDLLN